VVTVTQDASTVAVEGPGTSGISVYPNPASGSFTIVPGTGNPGPVSITLFDLTGRIVLERKTGGISPERIDVSLLPAGLYFLKLETKNGFTVIRLIIE
jgi:hypothetical protein